MRKVTVNTMRCHLCAKKFEEGDRVFMDPKDAPLEANTEPRLYCLECTELGLVGEYQQ